MDINVLKSYLVELGFEVDQPQLRKFEDVIRTVGNKVVELTKGITKDFAIMGTAVTTALTAIAAGTIGLVDSVAQADLGFQVMARRMFTTTDVARNLKIATDELGYSMEDIVFGPPELQERFKTLLELEQRMTKQLKSDDFEKQMRAVRDIRAEFTYLGAETKFFSMQVAAAIGRMLGTEGEKLLTWLKGFNEWFVSRMPQIADKLATLLVPVLKDVYRILGDIFSIGGIVGNEFLRVIGILFGDDRLLKGPLTFDKIAIAIRHVADATTWLFDKMKAFAEFIDSHPKMAILLGAGIGAVAGAAAGGGATIFAGGVGALPGAAIGAVAGSWAAKALTSGGGEAQNGSSLPEQARKAAQEISAQTGIPASIIFGQFEHETGGFTNRGATQLNNLSGIRYPGSTNYMKFDSIEAFSTYYNKLIHGKRYHDALGAQTPEDFARGLKIDGYYEDTYENYVNGLKHGMAQYAPTGYNLGSGSSTTNVGGVTVHITQPGATEEGIKRAVIAAISDKQDKAVQRHISQFSGVYA